MDAIHENMDDKSMSEIQLALVVTNMFEIIKLSGEEIYFVIRTTKMCNYDYM